MPGLEGEDVWQRNWAENAEVLMIVRGRGGSPASGSSVWLFSSVSTAGFSQLLTWVGGRDNSQFQPCRQVLECGLWLPGVPQSNRSDGAHISPFRALPLALKTEETWKAPEGLRVRF